MRIARDLAPLSRRLDAEPISEEIISRVLSCKTDAADSSMLPGVGCVGLKVDGGQVLVR